MYELERDLLIVVRFKMNSY